MKIFFRYLFCFAIINIFALQGLYAESQHIRKLDPSLQIIHKSIHIPAPPPGISKGIVQPHEFAPEQTVKILIRTSANRGYIESIAPGIKTNSHNGPIITAIVPISALEKLANNPNIQYIEISRPVYPQMDIAVTTFTESGNYLGIWASTPQNTMGGEGVIIGIIDSGIDWSHKDFIIDESSTSRLLYLWDQTLTPISGETNPSGYSYGVEYTQSQITDEIKGITSGKIRETDTSGHGTHVAGIAAGDGTSYGNGRYRGIAPNADLIIIKTSWQNSDILDGINYIFNKAQALGKSAVVNLSFGSQDGPHDGTSNFETAVTASVGQRKIITVAAGNDQQAKLHAESNIAVGTSTDTIFAINAPYTSIQIDIWHSAGDKYRCSVSTINAVVWAFADPTQTTTYALISGSTIYIWNTTNNPSNGDKEILIKINGDSTTLSGQDWVFRLQRSTDSTGDGDWDAWTIENASYFKDHFKITETVGDPGNAAGAITVGVYNSKIRWTDKDGNPWVASGETLGDLATFSSIGPTRNTTLKTGNQKPDITAPGQEIGASLSANSNPSASYILPGNKHRINQGTSMSCPMVSGVAALILQRNPSATPQEIKSLLNQNAKSDSYTASGPSGVNPVYAWGGGKINAAFLSSFSVSSTTVFVPQNIYKSVSVAGPSGNMKVEVDSATFSSNVYLTLSTVPSANLPACTQTGLNRTNVGTEIKTSLALTPQKDITVTIDYTDSDVSGMDKNKLVLIQYNQSQSLWDILTSSSMTNQNKVQGKATGLSKYAVAELLPPNTPSGFGGVATGSTTINWSWADNSGNEMEFRIKNSTDGIITTLGVNTTFWIENNLNVNTSYYRYVEAYNTTGTSSSTAVSKYTLAMQPGTLSFGGVWTSSVVVTWGDTNPSGTQYSVESSTGTNGAYAEISSGTGTGPVTHAGLNANTTYYYKVRARNGDNVWTNHNTERSTHTLAVTPGSVAFVGIFASSVTLSWTDTNPAGTFYSVESSSGTDGAYGGIYTGTYTTTLTHTGLKGNSTHYYRVRARNYDGIWTAYNGEFIANTTAAVPGIVAFGGVWTSSLTVIWGDTNELGTIYSIEASTTVNTAFGAIYTDVYAVGVNHTGLNVDTTYYYRVRAQKSQGGWTDYNTETSTRTKANIPGAITLTGVYTSSITLTWGQTNQPWTTYELWASTSTNNSYGLINSTAGTSGEHIVLSANVTYYYKVRAKNFDGEYSSYNNERSTHTLAVLPGTIAFSDISSFTVMANWTNSGNSGGTMYYAEGSSISALGPFTSNSGWTSSLNYKFTNLLAETTYYFRVKARNLDGIETNYTYLGYTETTPGVPDGFIGVAISSVSIGWLWNDNAINETGYRIKTSTGGIIASFGANTTFWIENGLSVNGAYSRFIEAYNAGGASSSTTIVRYTLANPTTGTFIIAVTTFSVSIGWLANNNPWYTCWGILRSTDNFTTSTTTIKSFTDDHRAEIFIDSTQLYGDFTDSMNVKSGTTYYYKVNAFNGDAIASASGITVSTRTLDGPVQIQVIPGEPKTVTINISYGEVKIEIPANTFTETVNVTIKEPDVLPPVSILQSEMKGSNIALEIKNDKNLQPQNEILVTINYRDNDIAGMDELKLIIGYYDETIFYQRWVILPSVVYPDSNKVTGRIKHLSIFRILQLFAAANLSSVIVYPNPYKPGATGINKQFSDPLLGTGIIFSGLTSKANIKIYNIAAELVYETDETDGNGINLWNTENKDGDKVASGLYIYYITNPDDTKMKPVKGKFTIVR